MHDDAEADADDLTLPRRSPALKIATLLFSGGLASLAILRGSAGCEAPAAATFDDDDEIDELLPRWRRAAARARPIARDDDDPPGRTLGGSKSDADALGTRELERAARYFGGAKADPDIFDAHELAPAPRYLGGSKSDADVWGGLTGEEIAPVVDPPAKRRLAK